MAKKRVHQLAKELNIKPQEIVDTLKSTEYAVSSIQSGLTEEVEEFVRRRYTGASSADVKKQAAAPETERAAAPETTHTASISKPVTQEPAQKQKESNTGDAAGQQAKAADASRPSDRPKKKSNITAIFNAQYSNGNGSKRSGSNNGGRGGRQRRDNNSRQEAPHSIIRPRPVGERAMRPISERTAHNRDEFADRTPAEQTSVSEHTRVQENRQRPEQQERPQTKEAVEPKSGEQARSKEETMRGGSRILGNIYANGQNAERTGEIRSTSGNGMQQHGDRNGSRNNKERGSFRNGGARNPQSGEQSGSRTGDRNGMRGERNGNSRNGERNTFRAGGDRRNERAGQGNDRGAARNNDRGGMRNNDRGNNYNGNRNAGGDRRSERTGGAQGGDRRNTRPQNGRDRYDRNGGYGADSAAPEEVRGKESRERNNNYGSERKNNNRRQDYDKLGSKRQENYINLERHGGRKKQNQQPQPQKEAEDVIKTITLPEKMTIRELADKMKLQPSAIVKKLFLKGEMVTVNSEVTFEEAEEIALEFNFICEAEEKIDVIAELLKEEEENEGDMVPRSPVVCVMGHVDHGKTSLLDAIRSTRVTDREAGGITQHIGASVVSINGQSITFLDTPGHEAFTAMRMRGANSTDIAVLVVAADDGVMPQTVEAINHAKAANVEMIVAINKIDKVGANPEKVKQELTEYELIPEDWGGSTVFCEVSAHTGEGIDNLLEMILLTAEVLELRANPNRNARGLVIEAQLDKGRGAVATMLVQKGTLHVGDPVACGSCYGKVRAMIDDQGRRVKEATPSMPVEILGLNSVPNAGEVFVVTDSEKAAKEFADTYVAEEKNRLIEETRAKMSLDDLFSQIQSGNMKELDIIVKADVQGSVEAVKQSLEKLSNEEVAVKVIHGGVGAINESDVILASASNAIIIGFNVRPDPIAKVTADREGVDVRLYKVIYNAIEDVEAAMKGMLDPVFEEKILGHAEIRQIFKASGVGNIAGSYVLDGTIERGCKVRISREGTQIYEGDLASLKRFKDDVKEVRTGFECGLVFQGYNDIQELDIVEAYKMVEVPR